MPAMLALAPPRFARQSSPDSPTDPQRWRQQLDDALAGAGGRVLPERFRASSIPTESLNIPGLEAALPGGGLARGAVSELICRGASTVDPAGAAGAITLLLPMLRRLTKEGKIFALVDNGAGIYPPALANAGVDLSNLLILMPKRRSDVLWCIEQCARSPAVAAVAAPVARLRDVDVRRLQLACEEGGGVCALLRPEREESSAASATMRLRVGPHLVYSPAGNNQRSVAQASLPVQNNQNTHAVPFVFAQEHGAAPSSPRRALLLEVLRLRGQPLPAPMVISIDSESYGAHSDGQALAMSASPLALQRTGRTPEALASA